MKKIILLGATAFAFNSIAQTTLYSENFNSSNTFTLNSSDLGASTTNNLWIVNNSYAGGTFNFTFMGFQIPVTVGATPNQPVGITGAPNSNYMHITSQAGLAGGVSNANFVAADGTIAFPESNFSKMTGSVNTVGMSNATLSFYWLCSGSASAFGQVYYSTDGGTSWVLKAGTYNMSANWAQATLTDPAWNNQANLRFAFRFVTNVGGGELDPAFSLDDIRITATPSGAVNTTSTTAATSCGPYTSPSGNYTWSASATYMDTIPNAAGADSIMTVNLTINTVNVSTSVSGVTMMATATGAVYQWINCAGNTTIAGANMQGYTPTMNGSYAVIVTQSGCSDTSNCITISSVSIDENDYSNQFSIYPNPANENATLDFGSVNESLSFEVITVNGSTVLSGNNVNGNTVQLPLNKMEKGVYFISIASSKGTNTIRFVRN